MPIWPFKRSRADRDAELLLAAVSKASRQSALFGEARAPDTLEGRFEVLVLHASLALLRLRAEPTAEALSQSFTDKLFRHLDAGLREEGVGDLVVPKRMRKLAGAFYGRLKAYAAALQSDDQAALAAAVARNIWGGEASTFAEQVAAYFARSADLQAGEPLERLLSETGWPPYLG